jgi:hypothetical protein
MSMMRCIEVEPSDPRFMESNEAKQEILEELQKQGWHYAETRDDRLVLSQTFESEQVFLSAFETASASVGQSAALQEVPCESAYG